MRMEYKEATLEIGRQCLILGPSQKEIWGGGWYWTLFMAAILLAGSLIFTMFFF